MSKYDPEESSDTSTTRGDPFQLTYSCNSDFLMTVAIFLKLISQKLGARVTSKSMHLFY